MQPDDPDPASHPQPQAATAGDRSMQVPPDAGHDGAGADRAAVGLAPRDYPVSSEDRNTKRSEHDWPAFRGGVQRVAVPGTPPVDGEEESGPN